jgi:3-oxoacyl-[acyl-carrier protein] reductase
MIRGSVDSYSLEGFDRMLAINVRAAFVGIQAASEHMKGGGRIILIGSSTAVRTVKSSFLIKLLRSGHILFSSRSIMRCIRHRL